MKWSELRWKKNFPIENVLQVDAALKLVLGRVRGTLARSAKKFFFSKQLVQEISQNVCNAEHKTAAFLLIFFFGGIKVSIYIHST